MPLLPQLLALLLILLLLGLKKKETQLCYARKPRQKHGKAVQQRISCVCDYTGAMHRLFHCVR